MTLSLLAQWGARTGSQEDITEASLMQACPPPFPPFTSSRHPTKNAFSQCGFGDLETQNWELGGERKDEKTQGG